MMMTPRQHRPGRQGYPLIALTLLLAATACSSGSGGGGIGSAPAPTPAPSPTPSPAPTPTPTPAVNYDTAEYRATAGAVSMNALAAYSRGNTGAGVAVGIVDSGIDLQSEEFGSRISPASAAASSASSVDDEGGHGTAVAFTLAGRRNGAFTHGVAFDATLVIARADTPGSCNANTTGESGCSYSDTAIGRGIDLGVANGARVINISLGGSAPSSTVVNAINRATQAGVIIVISAGNDGDPNPDPFAQIAANTAVSRNLVIIAGSVGTNDQISSFSNRAGTNASHYLAAVGESVRAPDENNTAFLWSGTSFSAPQISGAVALLAQAFPSLSGAQIVSLLFSSARDAGAVGSDNIYGGGILDLTRAFSPIGGTSVAGGTGPVSQGANASLSPAMGDAQQGEMSTIVLDSYARAFTLKLGQTVSRAAPRTDLARSLQTRQTSLAANMGRTSVAVTLDPVAGSAANGVAVNRLLLSPDDARGARAIAGMVAQRMGAETQVAIGFAQGGGALAAHVAGRPDPAFLIARDPVRGTGFDARPLGAFALRTGVGGWGLTASVEAGEALYRDPVTGLATVDARWRTAGYSRASLSADRHFGPLLLSAGASWLNEQDTLLGAHFSAGFGAARGTSLFVDGEARLSAGGGLWLGGAVRHGWTQAQVRAGLSGGGTIRSLGYALDAGKDGVLAKGDGLALRIAQPLRVTGGGFDLWLPGEYTYSPGAPGGGAVTAWNRQFVNLAPQGRETSLEARYALPLWGGSLQSHLFWRREPGHFAAAPDDVGGAVRYRLEF